MICFMMRQQEYTEIWVEANYFHKREIPWAFQPQSMQDEHSVAWEPLFSPGLSLQMYYLCHNKIRECYNACAVELSENLAKEINKYIENSKNKLQQTSMMKVFQNIVQGLEIFTFNTILTDASM